MSKPSYSNIELWLFELAEGNLSPDQIEDLRIFLLEHPEIDVDVDMWEMAKVQPSKVFVPEGLTASLQKERPYSLYAAIGATSMVLLFFVGCYQLLNVSALEKQRGSIIASRQSSSETTKITKENKELEQLQKRIYYLQKENERLTNDLASQRMMTASSTPSFSSDFNAPHGAQDRISQNRNTEFNAQVEQSLLKTNSQILNSNSEKNGINDWGSSNFALLDVESNASVKQFNHNLTEFGVKSYSTNMTSTREYDLASNSSKYKRGIKSRLKSFGRTIQRMMDNPIALKNSRDPHFHVPGMLPTDINFSSTGTLLATRIQTLSRLQWLGEENEAFMNQLSVDGYSYGLRGGIGVQVSHGMYKNGGLQVADVAVTYAPKLSFSKFISVEPSFRFKMGSKLLDHNKMEGTQSVEFDRQNVYDYYPDGQTPIGRQLWYKDLGAGLMVNTQWFFAGINFDNLLNHQDNVYAAGSARNAGTRFTASLGTDWENNRKTMRLSPYVVYNQYENLQELWGGINYRWEWFNVGASVSTNLDPAASIGVNIKKFYLNYNADYTTSLLTNKRSLSHQISLRLLIKPSRFYSGY
jgi:hypothetical protein